jgi:hypothetical protein
MEEIKALSVSVYLFPLGECTNNGLSAGKKSLPLVGDIIEGAPVTVPEGSDYLVLEYRERFNDYIAVPKSLRDAGKWPMFGGNFAYTSDSRFPASAPIKIFDRVEG